MEQVCLSNLPEVVGMGVTGLVTVMSLLANVVKADSVVGKVIHALALNLTVAKK